MRPRGRIPAAWGLGLALLAYWLMAVSVSPHMGVTADEVVHVTGGYTYWKFNDYRMHPENGTLAMRIEALPWLQAGVKHPPLTDPTWLSSKVNLYGRGLFFEQGNDVRNLLGQSRMIIALVGVFTVWLTWRWARGLFGPAAGWLALGLAVFCPTLLAHGGLATSDMVMTACVLGALSLAWRLLHRVTWGGLLGTTIACGLAFLSKMSGVLVVPLLGALLALRIARGTPMPVALGRRVRLLRGRWRVAVTASTVLIAVAAGSVVVLWAGYGFRFSGFNDAVSRNEGYYFSWDVILDRAPIPQPYPSELDVLSPHRALHADAPMLRMIDWLRERRLLPEAYLWGFAHTYKFSQYRPAFLAGEYRATGWKLFFPAAFLLKSTMASLALLAAGIATLLWFGRGSAGAGGPRPWTYRAAPLLLFFAVYWATAINMHLNIGHRHILPTYPVCYVLASGAALWLGTRWRRIAVAALAAAVAIHAADSWLARPFYLSYFTPLVGGRDAGYRFLVDSSYDWGQGLPDLARWIAGRKAAGDTAPVMLSYFGADSPRVYGISAERFGDEISDSGPRMYPAQLHGGWLVISATNFTRVYLPTRGPWSPREETLYQSVQAQLKQAADAADRPMLLELAEDLEALQFARLCCSLRDRRPDAVVGGSLLAFRLTDGEVARALYGPPPYPRP